MCGRRIGDDDVPLAAVGDWRVGVVEPPVERVHVDGGLAGSYPVPRDGDGPGQVVPESHLVPLITVHLRATRGARDGEHR